MVRTSRKRFPLAGFVALTGGQSCPQHFKIFLHVATPFPFRQLVGLAQFRGATVWRGAIRRIWVVHDISDLLVLQGMMVQRSWQFYVDNTQQQSA